MRLTEHVTYIGAANPNLRVFDIIMKTEHGTSYNSYLIRAEKTAVIETVHADYGTEFLRSIERLMPAEQVDYVILNHTEPDHAGSLELLLERNPNIEVYGTKAALKNLEAIMNRNFKGHVVSDGEILELGEGICLEFIIAPNLHWPDSMFTYLEAERILFSCDVFGSHFCETGVVDQFVKYPDTLRKERENYFDCIFGPFKKFIRSGLKKIEHKKFELICPSHGPVLQKYLKETVEQYEEWSREIPTETYVAIFYVSAYGYTKYMAERFAKEIRKTGTPVRVYNVIEHDLKLMTEALNGAGAVMFGSPTINRDALKPVWDLISGTDAMNVRNKPALTFGSYGWSGEACRYLNERLRALGYKVFGEGVTCIFKPSEEDKVRIEQITREFITALAQ